MALEDAKPTESPLGMAVASNAVLAGLIQVLLDQKVITGMQILILLTNAQRDVNSVADSDAHASAGVVLQSLLTRFPFS
jgi:transcriptional regulator CtsR